MHPVVIIFLIFAALGGLYFLYTQQAGAVGGATGTLQAKLGPHSHQIVMLAEVVIILLVAWYLFNYFRSVTEQRASSKRLRESYSDRGPTQKR